MPVDRVLLVANDLFHPYGHRIMVLVPYVEALCPVRAVSLVPPGLGKDGTQASPGEFLRGWARRVIRERAPLVWSIDGTVVARRFPLPDALGPLFNLALLRLALRRVHPCADLTLAQGPVAAMACLHEGIPFVYDHADDYRGGRVGPLHRRIFGRWQAQALRHATAVSCAGFSLYDHAVAWGARRVALHPNGVWVSFFASPRAEWPEPTILFLGALEWDCGIDLVIEALALMDPSVRLAVVGSGPARARFSRLASRRGCAARVRWLGAVPRESIPGLLASAWVGSAVLRPSRWNRFAFHLKILEYMAAGLPFITTPIGDGARLARETGAGLVAAPDPYALAEAFQSLLEDGPRRALMSSKAREGVAPYDWGVRGPLFASWLVSGGSP